MLYPLSEIPGEALPDKLPSFDAAVDAVLDRIPGPIVLGLPLGIGKPNPFVNALYRRIKANPSRRLTIVTALSMVAERPVKISLTMEEQFFMVTRHPCHFTIKSGLDKDGKIVDELRGDYTMKDLILRMEGVI